MQTRSRRQVLGAGLALSSLAAAWPLLAGHRQSRRRTADRRAGVAAAAYAALDPRDPAVFTNPLRLPSAGGGLFGLLDVPSSAFDLRASRQTLELLPDKPTQFLAYAVEAGGRQFLNPTLRLRQGENIHTRLLNELDEPTIVHWHGLHVETSQDGHPAAAIGPGESYRYDVPVVNRGGLYWYHPHPDMLTARQAYFGQAGLLLVEDDDELRLRADLDLELGRTDIPLVIQDKRLDEDGQLVYSPSPQEQMMGWTGDVIAVNGTVNPQMVVTPRTYRLRLLNGSNARIYRPALIHGDRRLPLLLIGTDGGLLAEPQPVDQLFLAPGERVDLLVDLRALTSGDVVLLKSVPFNPMHNEMMMGMGMGGMMAGASGAMDTPATTSQLAEGVEFILLKMLVQDGPHYDLPLPSTLSQLPPFAQDGAPSRPFLLTAQAGQWRINGARFAMSEDLFTVRANTTEVWAITNHMMSMPHPMHWHGFMARVLERRGSPAQVRASAVDIQGRLVTDLGLKDTVLIWPGETVRLAIDFSHSFTGEQRYLYHCHILEHEDQGMMVNFRVV